MTPALCILAAGRGGRLGDRTAAVNKGLLPVGHQAAISHIIEKAPLTSEIVVAVGYEKEALIEYCEAAHPDRDFRFVAVPHLDGPGSGPGFSLRCCEPFLQRPFYLCNVDTLIDNPLPPLDTNWIGVDTTDRPDLYATVETERDGRITRFHGKQSTASADFHLAYIGLAGIVDWRPFWQAMEEYAGGAGADFQYVEAFRDPERYAGGLRTVRFTWLDTGSVAGYEEAVRYFGPGEWLGMPKSIPERTYAVDGRVVKLCWDEEKNRKRQRRARLLAPHAPPLSYQGRYVTAYPWIEGSTLY
jgi:NDP-sugar pyrophosphorylase family protein